MTIPKADYRAAWAKITRPDLSRYEEIYRRIHQNPELSGQETETGALVAQHLRDLKFTHVLDKIGRTGVVGILENGEDGPVVLIRSELDALPILEKTNLPYASTKQMEDENSDMHPVFHACGHDMHITCLLACSELLVTSIDAWSGTLIVLFQPAEENFRGARAMIDDGLYDKVPQPSVMLAQHTEASRAGTVAMKSGPLLTASDRFSARIHGLGGHGSNPAKCRDPIVAAAQIISSLQTVVSREISPADFATVTCSKIRGGNSAGSVAEYADMTFDMRSYEPEVRKTLRSSLQRMIEKQCEVLDMPQKPEIRDLPSVPATINDDETYKHVRSTFQSVFKDAYSDKGPDTASEDFGLLWKEHNVPYCYWKIGCVGEERWKKAEKDRKLQDFPTNHHAQFYPDTCETLQTGVDAMAAAALSFCGV